jgi:lysozyme family protein
MSDRFPRAFALLKIHEGGFVDHPDDPGGATMKGVTQRVYDNFRTARGLQRRTVRQIEDAEVETIYRLQYWNAVRADDLPPGVAYCVFDAAVNSGPARAARWLQACVGARQDGVVGQETLAMTKAAKASTLINSYCDMRLAFMQRLPHWRSFKNGWTRRVAEVRSQSLIWAQSGHASVPVSNEGAQPQASGPETATSTLRDALRDPAAVGAVGGLLGGVSAVASGDGPVQYALAVVLVVVALAGVWVLLRKMA